MKTKNLVLSVLILLLALVSTAAGYFLFAKRSELSSGWTKMASAINRSAAELDRNSGTASAKSLEITDLSFANFPQLEKRLRVYSDQIGKAVKNRNKLAAALCDVGLKVDFSEVDAAALKKIETSGSASGKTVRAFGKAIDVRDRNFNQVSQIAKRHLDVELDPVTLRSGERSALAPMESAIAANRKRNAYYEGKLKEIAVMTDSPAVFTASEYRNSATGIADAVDRLKAENTEIANQLAMLRASNSALRNSIVLNKAEAVNLDKDIAVKRQEVGDIKVQLGIAADQDPMPWRNGSVEARAALVGNVIRVSDDFGYVAIDFGADTKVTQALGKGFIRVNPRIVPGMKLTVLREKFGGDKETVTHLDIYSVGPEVSIANITADTPAIEVGDKVVCEFIN